MNQVKGQLQDLMRKLKGALTLKKPIDIELEGGDYRVILRHTICRFKNKTCVTKFELALQEGETPERVRLARIELDFGGDSTVAEEDWPVIVGLSPVRFDMDQTQRNITTSYGITLSLKAFGVVVGSPSWSRKVTSVETAGITISGSGPFKPSPNLPSVPLTPSSLGLGTSRARWIVRENAQTRAGIPERIPAALFLLHQPGIPLHGTLTIDLRVGRGRGASVVKGWRLRDFAGEFDVVLDGSTVEPVGDSEVEKALNELMGDEVAPERSTY